MNTIKVNLGKRSYDIVVGWNILNKLGYSLSALNIPRDVFVVTNNTIKSRYAAMLNSSLRREGFRLKFYSVPDSEKAKSISSSVRSFESLADYARYKKVAIIAFGGGVVGDLASFVASVYKRGVPLVHIPTTLVAQIDSSIGGKTAIDLPMAKNLLGTFYQPKFVFCDLSFLKSLDKNQMRAGLAEAIKYAIIKGGALFGFLENSYQEIFAYEPATLQRLVFECVRAKARIVEADEREEKGLRTILNLGHTIGHAIEAAGGYVKFSHGEAISVGMLCAAKISLNMDIMAYEVYQRIANLISSCGLPQEISGVSEKDILTAYKLDKKFIGRTNRFVLIKDIGKPLVYENVPERIIHNSLKEFFV